MDAVEKRVEAHAIDELGRLADGPEAEIGALAGFQRADLAGKAKRPCRLARDAGQAFGNGEAEQGGAHVHRQQQRGQRRCAGVAVGGKRHRRPVLSEEIDRRLPRLADEIEGAGQQDCDRAAFRHRHRPGLVRVLDMIGRQRPAGGCKRCTAEIGKLVGVEFHRQTERLRTVEDAPDLLRREGDAFAEAVNGIHQTGGMRGLQSRQHDVVDEIAVAAAIFGRRRMRPEIGGGDADGTVGAQAPGGAQHLHLVGHRQPVAGFDLDRRHPFGHQRIETRQAFGNQHLLARLPDLPDGGDDAAAGPGNLLIGGTGEPHLELACPVSGKDQMGVAVDQTRRDPAPAAIDALGAAAISPGSPASGPT